MCSCKGLNWAAGRIGIINGKCILLIMLLGETLYKTYSSFCIINNGTPEKNQLVEAWINRVTCETELKQQTLKIRFLSADVTFFILIVTQKTVIFKTAK